MVRESRSRTIHGRKFAMVQIRFLAYPFEGLCVPNGSFRQSSSLAVVIISLCNSWSGTYHGPKKQAITWLTRDPTESIVNNRLGDGMFGLEDDFWVLLSAKQTVLRRSSLDLIHRFRCLRVLSFVIRLQSETISLISSLRWKQEQSNINSKDFSMWSILDTSGRIVIWVIFKSIWKYPRRPSPLRMISDAIWIGF
jgi:hypothetical protein